MQPPTLLKNFFSYILILPLLLREERGEGACLFFLLSFLLFYWQGNGTPTPILKIGILFFFFLVAINGIPTILLRMDPRSFHENNMPYH